MKKIFFLFFATFFILHINTFALSQDMRHGGSRPAVTELKQIIESGGSIIVDLEKQNYSAAQLRDLASGLKFQSTLTIKMGDKPLSPAQCSQIARARPGQVIFWF